jgi:hypothetical protein
MIKQEIRAIQVQTKKELQTALKKIVNMNFHYQMEYKINFSTEEDLVYKRINQTKRTLMLN